MQSFDPHNLLPTASLNRVQVVDLPGLNVDPNVKGQSSYQLLSAASVTQLIRRHTADLQLDPNLDDHALRIGLDQRFDHPDPSVRQTAEHIAHRLGRNMGYVLLTLKRGDRINREAREEWDFTVWDHWATINQIILGGGIVNGPLGSYIKEHSLEVLHEGGFDDMTVHLSPYGSSLPMVGSSRHAPPGCEMAMVFDFGHTTIKRGFAIYRNNQLTELRRLPDYPTSWSRSTDNPTRQATALFDQMVSIIAETGHANYIFGSLAAYMRDGQPLKAQHGAYMQLRHITDNLQDTLTQAVSQAMGQTTSIVLLHDGTAAATTYAGASNTAVITMGTSLGFGFPPSSNGLLTLSPQFSIVEVE